MKYTFLLPAYKTRFLEEALLGIKCQSFVDFLCIVSDDCSPEDVKGVFDKVCADDPRFTYRRTKKNFGADNLAVHWNSLVGLCDTEYFMVASDDDIYHPDFLMEIDKLVARYPDAGVVRARSQYIDSKGEVLKKDGLYDEHQDTLSYLYTRYNCSYIGGILNYAFRKEVFQKEKLFFEYPLAWFADDVAIIACSRYGICVTKDILTSMRISGSSISSSADRASALKKIYASVLFFNWSKIFLHQNCHPTNALTAMMLRDVTINVRKHSLDQVKLWTPALSFLQKTRILAMLVGNGYSKGGSECFFQTFFAAFAKSR